MEFTRYISAILLIMLTDWSTEVLVKGEFIKPLNIIYPCHPSSETVVNLSAYNLTCDDLNASINNKPVIVSNRFSPPIINSMQGKNLTIHGCHIIEYICGWSVKSDHMEKQLIIKGIENHNNNTDKGIKDSKYHHTDGIENHKKITNKDEKSSRNPFMLGETAFRLSFVVLVYQGIPLGFVIFIALVLLIVLNRKKIRCWFQSCCQQEEFSQSQRHSALPEVV